MMGERATRDYSFFVPSCQWTYADQEPLSSPFKDAKLDASSPRETSFSSATNTSLPEHESSELHFHIGPGNNLCDQFGRSIHFRGVNICAKVPDGHHGKSNVDLLHHEKRTNVSFIDLPVPLREAKEHFVRLRLWGLTLIRFGITWESLEHEGP